MTAEQPASFQLGDRSLFPTLKPRAYLNHAAISPPSRLVAEAASAVVSDYAQHGVAAFGRWRDQRENLRQDLAELIGARPIDLAFLANTTRTVTEVALCFPWRKGDGVLCFEGEFPANVTPWQRAADAFGLKLHLLSVDRLKSAEGLEQVARELARGIRLVAVSAVQFQTGFRSPLRRLTELAHSAGAEVFVDGIQACGAVPIDVGDLGVDYLGCGSHKWLMGLEGAAFLYVRPERAAALVPRTAGWLSHQDGMRFLFEGAGHLRYDRRIREEIAWMESGAYNAIGLAALSAAVAPIKAIGVGAIFEHITQYLDDLELQLADLGFRSERSGREAERSGTLAVHPPPGQDVVALAGRLNDAGVAVTTPDGRLRFAPHWPNALDEVPFVVEVVRKALPTRE